MRQRRRGREGERERKRGRYTETEVLAKEVVHTHSGTLSSCFLFGVPLSTRAPNNLKKGEETSGRLMLLLLLFLYFTSPYEQSRLPSHRGYRPTALHVCS